MCRGFFLNEKWNTPSTFPRVIRGNARLVVSPARSMTLTEDQ